MNQIDAAVRSIKKAAEAEGLPAFAKRAGVPYTTLVDWQKAGWKPKAVATLERLTQAAAATEAANDDAATSEAA